MSVETDLAWVAGFLDGDGTICLSNNGCGTPYPFVGITQVLIEPLEHARAILGKGNIHKTSQNHRAYGKRQLYQVAWRGYHECARVCHLLEPYLVVKKEQAQLLLSLPYPKTGRGARNPLHHRAKQRMQKLNASV